MKYRWSSSIDTRYCFCIWGSIFFTQKFEWSNIYKKYIPLANLTLTWHDKITRLNFDVTSSISAARNWGQLTIIASNRFLKQISWETVFVIKLCLRCVRVWYRGWIRVFRFDTGWSDLHMHWNENCLSCILSSSNI